MSPSVAAVILAAGFGTRLAPLTDTTPKPLLDVGGMPVINYLLTRLRQLDGLTQVVVVINDQHPAQWQHWHDALDDASSVSIVSNGVTSEDERRGAVADLALAVEYIDAMQPADQIVVLAGDNLIDESLQPHLDAAVTSGRPVVLCRDLGDDVPPNRFGEITVDASGVITRFREKPDHPESPLAATCSYVLPGSVAGALATYLATGDVDSPGAFIGWLATDRPVTARPLTGTYYDIGNHETLAAARAARQHLT